MTPNPAMRLLASGPFRFGFIASLGVLLGLALGAAIGSLGYALTLIFLSLFVSLGLYPVVLRLERLRLSRTVAVLIVMIGFVIVVALLIWMLVPVITEQIGELLKYIPRGIDQIEHQDWFEGVNSAVGGALLPFVEQLEAAASDPGVWLAISGGALRVGANILNGTLGVVFVVALTLYFVGSLEMMKRGLYSLVPRSRRVAFSEIAEEIFQSVGKYLNGMFLLAVINAAFTFVLLTAMGVRFAPIVAALALPITFIPVVGPLISTLFATFVSLFTSPSTALIVLIVLFVYMQVEAYLLTPRVVGKAIQIPGSLVLIGAMVGASLLGLLGALVACPVSASLLLIAKKVIVPAQDAR